MLAAVCARISPDDPIAGLEVREIPEPTPADGWEVELHWLCAFLEQTGVRPLVGSEHALADAHAAFTRLEAGAEFGRIVVVP